MLASGLLALAMVGSAEAATWTVTAVDDANDGYCGAGHCSLREAIESASPGDRIVFDFGGLSWPYTIQLDSVLEVNAPGLTIDGFDCTGCAGVTPNSSAANAGLNMILGVQILGNATSGDPVLIVDAAGVQLSGLNIAGGGGSGLEVSADNVTAQGLMIGTDLSGSYSIGNGDAGVTVLGASGFTLVDSLVSGNGGSGLYAAGGVSDLVVENCIIGLGVEALNTVPNGGHGVHVMSFAGATVQRPRIGTVGAGNVISGNNDDGVRFEGDVEGQNASGSASYGLISGNWIGTDGEGIQSLGNGGNGIALIASAGGSSALWLTDNVVGGSGLSGIRLQGVQDSVLRNNQVGVSGANVVSNSDDGVTVLSGIPATQDLTIGGVGPAEANTIANNGMDGIRVQTTNQYTVERVTISGNSMHGNAGLGIDLEAATSGDGPLSPPMNNCVPNGAMGNNGIGAPEVTEATISGDSVELRGFGCAGATVEIFESDGDTSGYGEPMTYVDSVEVGSTGDWFYGAVGSSLAEGAILTFTQTTAAGSTSEASAWIGLGGGCDADGDGHLAQGTCGGDDCDDGNPEVNPDKAEELCTMVDEDCDPDTPDAPDEDDDGSTECDGDCDDGYGETYPGAPELCDGLDNDCDGEKPEEEDADDDDVMICQGDCDDTDAAIGPFAEEICGDGIDQDCDDLDPGCGDQDKDGDGSPAGLDCNDDDASVFPGASEVCDVEDVDHDCDGVLSQDEIDCWPNPILNCSHGGSTAPTWLALVFVAPLLLRRRRSLLVLALLLLPVMANAQSAQSVRQAAYARAELDEGDFERALRSAESALVLSPDYGEAMFLKALAYEGLGELDLAKSTLESYLESVDALERDPDAEPALARITDAMKRGGPGLARERDVLVIEATPELLASYRRRVEAALKRGDCRRAQQASRELTRAAPDEAAGWRMAGDAARCDNQVRSAAMAYRRFQALGGEDRKVDAVLEALSSDLASLTVKLALEAAKVEPLVTVETGGEILQPVEAAGGRYTFHDLPPGGQAVVHATARGMKRVERAVTVPGPGEGWELELETEVVGIGALRASEYDDTTLTVRFFDGGRFYDLPPERDMPASAAELVVRIKGEHGQVDVPVTVAAAGVTAFDVGAYEPASLTVTNLPRGATVRVFVEGPEGLPAETLRVTSRRHQELHASGIPIVSPQRFRNLVGGAGGVFVAHPNYGEAAMKVFLAPGSVNALEFNPSLLPDRPTATEQEALLAALQEDGKRKTERIRGEVSVDPQVAVPLGVTIGAGIAAGVLWGAAAGNAATARQIRDEAIGQSPEGVSAARDEYDQRLNRERGAFVGAVALSATAVVGLTFTIAFGARKKAGSK